VSVTNSGITATWRGRARPATPTTVDPAARATVARRLVLVPLALGVAVRVALLLAPSIWYDEAMNGLVALGVLRGELPIYLYGQAFMGVLDAYLAAPFHYLFGPSILTLKLLPLALTLTWLGLTVRLAHEAFGPRAAALAATLLAVPPNFLLSWAIETRTKYHLCVTLGTLALLLALRPLGREPRRDLLRVGVLGLVLGLAFWTNFLSVVFFPSVAILVLRHGIRPALRGLPVAAATFGLGSLPHWIYGLRHGTAMPDGGGWIGWTALAEHLVAAGRVAWPVVAGVPASVRDERVEGALSVALAVVLGLAIALATRTAWRRPGNRRAAMLALLALVVTNVGLAVVTEHGDRIDGDPKYLLPLYSALPVLGGAGLAALPWTAWAPLLAGLLTVQVAGASALWQLGPEGRARVAADRRAREETLAILERQGPDRFYTASAAPFVLVYLSNERIVASDPYQEGYPPYARAVDGAPRVGWWVDGDRDDVFEANLAALGARAALRPLGSWGAAYVDFTLPAEGLRELDPATLRVIASPHPEAAASMLDRDAGTFWGSGGPRLGGEWIQVDLGRIEPVALVRWLPRVFQEAPSGLRLEASLDGVTWRRLVELEHYAGPAYWSAGRPMRRVRSGRVELRLAPTPARYLRIVQTGVESRWQWSVQELFVYAADPTAPPTPAEGVDATLADAVRAAGVRRLYADHGWSQRLALADPELQVPPANLPLDPYNFTGPDSELVPLVHWAPGSGALVEPPDVPGFLRTAEASGLGVRRIDLGGLSLFVYQPPGLPIPHTELRVTASVAPERASRAADGSLRLRWSTGRAQAAGDWLRVDLAAPRRVRAVRLWTTEPAESPRGLRLEGSVDGAAWTPLEAHVRTEHRVRWAGITWLREDPTAVWLEVPPVLTRSLRLVLTRDATDPWSIHELTVYVVE
jgi:hypothetical protein